LHLSRSIYTDHDIIVSFEQKHCVKKPIYYIHIRVYFKVVELHIIHPGIPFNMWFCRDVAILIRSPTRWSCADLRKPNLEHSCAWSATWIHVKDLEVKKGQKKRLRGEHVVFFFGCWLGTTIPFSEWIKPLLTYLVGPLQGILLKNKCKQLSYHGCPVYKKLVSRLILSYRWSRCCHLPNVGFGMLHQGSVWILALARFEIVWTISKWMTIQYVYKDSNSDSQWYAHKNI